MIVFFYIFASVLNSPAIHTTYTCRHSEKRNYFSHSLFFMWFFFLLFWISKRIFLCIFIHCSAIEKKNSSWKLKMNARIFSSFGFFRISVLWIGEKQNFFLCTVRFFKSRFGRNKKFLIIFFSFYVNFCHVFNKLGDFCFWWCQIWTKEVPLYEPPAAFFEIDIMVFTRFSQNMFFLFSSNIRKEVIRFN